MVADCLGALIGLDYPPDRYEIVIVDAACTDDTEERVRSIATRSELPRVRYVRTSLPDPNGARNRGLGIAIGDLLAFVDDDVLVPSGWLRALAVGAERWAEADCFGGPVRPVYEGSPPATCSAHEVRGATLDEGTADKRVDELWGCNMAVRRGALERVGRFREGLPVLQEWEWQRRLTAAGGQLVYLAQAGIWHRRDRTDLAPHAIVKDLFKRGYVQGRLGPPIILKASVYRAGYMLIHGILGRCAYGWGEAVRHLGIICGAAARSLSSR